MRKSKHGWRSGAVDSGLKLLNSALYLSADAEEDFLRIYRFNVERSLAWADRVERRLLERIWALASAPLSGRLHTRDGVRRVSVADIQYVIDYRIGTAAIEIMRIRHTREIR